MHYKYDLNATMDGILSGTAPVGPVVKEEPKPAVQPERAQKTQVELEQPWPTVFDSREVVRPTFCPLVPHLPSSIKSTMENESMLSVSVS